MSAVAGNAIRRERATVVACLLLVAAASWAWLLSGAGTMEEMDGMLMPMSSGPWTAGHAAIMLAMWAVMMAAMMLPSAVPMVLFYTTIAHRQRSQGHAGGSALLFTAGYVVIWAGFSAVATALQFGLERAALLSPMMETTSVVLAGCIMIGAGSYQWMPAKRACLQRCRSPLDFILENWRGGKAGALQMGFKHGLYCLGCCWVLMLLLFVGGVMNLAWIAGIALFVLVEKLAPAGHWIGRAAGALMMAWGAATLLAPVLLARAG
jgi:predicted metal-binding membrane protein